MKGRNKHSEAWEIEFSNFIVFYVIASSWLVGLEVAELTEADMPMV
jgi:hypothetical protein